ncbi:MAG: DNA polymerase III subunit alpha [Pseudomonadota bacterium]
MTAFAHLSLHSEFSLVDSTVRIDRLVEACRKDGMPAVALTDRNNLFALVKFYRKAIAAGVKPIVGADLVVENPDDAKRPYRLILLCQNRDGYRNLSQLITRAFVENQVRGLPTVRRDWLREDACESLIALSGGLHGEIGQQLVNGHTEAARRSLDHWNTVFPGRFYLELTRTGRPGEVECVQASLELAQAARTPVVASNDVRFLEADDFEAHEARVCIHEGRSLADPDRPRRFSNQQYLRNAAEMVELFADVPSAIENTIEIARRCSLDLELGKNVLPAFPIPDGQTEAEFLEAESRRGLDQALTRLFERNGVDVSEREGRSVPYRERLATELDVIKSMGFPGYFLIVADFIRWAKENDVPVGPGRGSGAGSLVAWVLGITDLDPLEHDLLFERFLNPERVSMPDFDVDFCMEGRDRVIDYVAQRYGRGKVSQIITFGTMAAKAVIRDTGRVLGHPYGFVDRIAKLIPFEIGMTLDKALDQSEELRQLCDEDEAVAAIVDLAKSLEGLARNAGKHAGGVVIAPTELTDFSPLYCEEGGVNAVTQLDKDDVEAIGLVKFDFLGLKTLTIIDWAEHIVRESGASDEFDVNQIPMRDEKTFKLLQSSQTAAVFQLESSGMRDLIKRLRPDQFDDLVALVALFRPGPLQSGMVDDFIARKHQTDGAEIDYLHPDLEPVLKETYGVILYQEQVMQIAQVLAGYTLGGADMLRRAMGKKKPEEMEKQRGIFVTGATERGVDEKKATHIFDLMEKFAGYGFNKSHSAAYAVLSYQTAYLKAHFPAPFMAAVMSADLDHTDRLVVLKDDVRSLGLKLLPPDINRSLHHFSVPDAQSILYGLGAIKGVGRSVVEAIIAERENAGPFSDISGFCMRLDADKINRRALEAIIKAGAMDGFGVSRRAMMEQVEEALKGASQAAKASAAGQNDMFGLSAPTEEPKVETDTLVEWQKRVKLGYEKEALGLYLTGHPFDTVRKDARFFVDGKLGEIASEAPPQNGRGERDFAAGRREVSVAGLVMDIRKRGNRVSVVLDDDSGRMEVSLFSEAANEFRHLLVKDEILVVSGALRYDDFIGAWTINAKNIVHVDRVIESRAQGMLLKIAPNGRGQQLLTDLHDVLLPYRQGHCDVSVQYFGADAAARFSLGAEWSVKPSRELRDKLAELLGSDNVRLLYTPGREIM